MNTPAISVTVVMKGEDIKAGSNLILSNNKGRIAPVVAAKVVIDIKLIYLHNKKKVESWSKSQRKNGCS